MRLTQRGYHMLAEFLSTCHYHSIERYIFIQKETWKHPKVSDATKDQPNNCYQSHAGITQTRWKDYYTMKDEFTSYEEGLKRLLEALSGNRRQHLKALGYEASLRENIKRVRLYSDNETLRSDRNRILIQLNDLAMVTINKSFNELCRSSQYPPKQEIPTALPTDFFDRANEYITQVRRSVEKALEIFSDRHILPFQCERMSSSFQHCSTLISTEEIEKLPLTDATRTSFVRMLQAIIHEVQCLLKLLRDFEPVCQEPAGQKLKRQIYKKLNELHRYMREKKFISTFSSSTDD